MQYREIGPGVFVYSNVIPDFEKIGKDIKNVLDSPDFEWAEPRIIRDGVDVVDYEVRDLQTTSIDYEESKNIPTEIKTKQEAVKLRLGNIIYKYCTPVEEDYKKIFGVDTVRHDV